MIELNQQVVVVTGAGRGLGRLYALECARRGASVVVNDVGGTMQGEGTDRSVADGVVDEIQAAGGSAVASHDSVATPEGGAAIVQAAVDTYGRLDAVVSNAGIYGMVPFDELPIEDWRRMLSVHLDGGFYLSQPAFKVMKSQGYGRLVFIASGIGAFGQQDTVHYAAAKSGVMGLTNALADQGAPHGILANSVLPIGYSRMVSESLGDREPVDQEKAFYEAIKPELVVPMVVFLASRACELTHHHFSAGAGRYARVFQGLTEGWLADGADPPTADDIAAHLPEVTSTERYSIPGSMVDEVFDLWARLGIS